MKFYVNAASGNDKNNGLSQQSPFKTIQRACDSVKPGSMVIVSKGIYYENIILQTPGSADAPISFIAEDCSRHSVLISGANADIREHRVKWQLHDTNNDLYSIPYHQEPHRVNYGDIDLFPYAGLNELNTFHLANDFPGPEHGFFYDDTERRLYVRLHKSERYGPTDPNLQIMNVGGIPAIGARRHIPTGREHVLFGVINEKSAHVIIDGFTFQSAGAAAVYAGADNITIKNCWFIGCPAGVIGRGEYEGKEYSGNHIRILHCDYGEPDVWQDAVDTIDKWHTEKNICNFYWWHRKYKGIKERCYERGMVILANDDWEVAHCYLHDCFEALSYLAFGKGSTNGHVHHCVFNRSIDNHIEFEYEMQNFIMHDNLFVDGYRHISYQAFERTPGPIWFFRNVIINSDNLIQTFEKAGKDGGSWNKFPIEQPIPKPGLLIYNNTILSRNSWVKGFNDGLHIFNNMFWVSKCEEDIDHPEFDGNIVFSETPDNAEFIAGEKGYVAKSLNDLGLIITGSFDDWLTLRLELKEESPATNINIKGPVGLTGTRHPSLNCCGAIEAGSIWSPPEVGPTRATSAEQFIEPDNSTGILQVCSQCIKQKIKQ